MHTFCVDKKINYSIPIRFAALPSSTKIEKSYVANKNANTMQQPAPKTVTKAIPPKPYVAKATKNISSKGELSIRSPQSDTSKKTVLTAPSPKIENKKTEELAKPKEEHKPIPIKNEEPKKNILPTIENSIEKKSIATKNNVPAQPSTQDAQISSNFREVEALRRGAQLQKELVNHWHPPVGVSPNCTCDISFFVNKQGKLENLKTTKSSGVMMFDISARQALFAMKMPSWTYGKPLMISFK